MPLASKNPVTDVIHGVKVVDPYRWLEDRNSHETAEWIGEQGLRCDAYFTQIAELDVLQDRARSHLNREVIDQPARLGSKLFYRRRKADQQQASICVREGGEERILFDPSSLGIYVSVAIQAISDDGRWLAIELKRDGSDRKEVLILSVETGSILDDRLPIGYGRGFAFAPDSAGFYYSHEIADQSADHTIHFHGFKNLGGEDEVVYRAPRSSASALFVLGDGQRIGAVHIRECEGVPQINLAVCSLCDPTTTWKEVFADKSGLYIPMLWRGRTFILTEEDTPNRSLIEIAENGELIRKVVPENDLLMRQLVLVQDRVYVEYLADRKPMISAWSLDGEQLEDIPVAGSGTVTLSSGFNSHGTSLFMVHESFVVPPSIWEYTSADGVTSPFSATLEQETRPDIRVDEVVYLAADGVGIPMSIVRERSSDHSRCIPLLLTAYGGFGVSMTPRYSVLVMILLELGAAFALPGIRGGAEFGKRWHEAGCRRNRKVAIDDFLAAAQWLIAEGLTSSDRLGIFGGSNAGLLVASAMVRRPDLFRAVLSIAPLLDMIRFDLFDEARRWRSEYGSPDDPEDFEALLEYSPYHNASESCDYPATLFVTGDCDDRCNPAHVRKMAALLQNRDAQENAIVVDYSEERGHSPVLPLSIRTDALARRLAFFCHELGIPVFKEVKVELARD